MLRFLRLDPQAHFSKTAPVLRTGPAAASKAQEPAPWTGPNLRRPTAAILGSALLLGLLGLLATLAVVWLGGLEGLAPFRASHGLTAAAALVPLQALISVSLLPVPSDAVALMIASLSGFWIGSGLIWIGWMAGAVLQYEVARRAGKHLDLLLLRSRLPERLREVDPGRWLFLICARWLPLGPHLVGTIAGALGVPRWRYLLAAGVATTPLAATIAAAGTGLGTWLGAG